MRDGAPGNKQRGTALRWNMDKGFGFLKPDGGGDDVFCHYKDVYRDAMSKHGRADLQDRLRP